MEEHQLRDIIEKIRRHELSPQDALGRLRDLPFHDAGFAKVDHHRALRTGWPEVIFCQGKTLAQVAAIIRQQTKHGETVFGTRASPRMLAGVTRRFRGMTVNKAGRCFYRKSKSWKVRSKGAPIVVAAAGTADLPVAEEAKTTVEVLGHPCTVLYDVGVSGIHRLFAYRKVLQKAPVVIVIAGMEGALPSVVAGLVACPVIGVPTSVGYGAHLGGLVPLFAMLNSCAAGLTVVNIDNGFGAGMAAALISDCGTTRKSA